MSENVEKPSVEELFERQSRDIERFLRFRLRNPEDARDLSQEAFLRLLRLDDTAFIQRPDQYLLRIAANLAYEHRLREKKAVNVDLDDTDELAGDSATHPDNTVERERQIARLEDALETLPTNVRNALIWHRRDGLTYQEIAKRLGVSPSMIKKYLQQGVARCRAGMQEVANELN
ncbi:MAG: RNA polymerase sigma factor [Pseudomonadota bacterium]